MTPVEKLVLLRFANLYGAPQVPDQKKFFAEYVRVLGQASPARLEAAIDRVVAANTFHIWPTVGACAQALKEVVIEQDRAREIANYKPAETRIEPSNAEKAQVQQIVARAKASLAAAEARWQQPGFAGIDREAWITRQTGLIAAGKWCLSTSLRGQAT